jgi:hypothetical protein
MAPNPTSAAAAVETLRVELDMVSDALSGLDRKAALVPAVLGATAGIFIAPDTAFTDRQQVLIVVALGTLVVAVVLSLRVLWAQNLNVGPNAQLTANGTHLEPAAFNHAVAGSLAKAVDQLSDLARWKGQRLNVAMWFAAATILFLALARYIGGLR